MGGRVELPVECLLENQVCLFGFPDEGLGFGAVGCEWLFEQDVFASYEEMLGLMLCLDRSEKQGSRLTFQCFRCPLIVEPVRRRNVYKVNFWVVEQCLV